MRRTFSLLCGAFVAVMTAAAWCMMAFGHGGTLASAGLPSLKYFTTLSNLLNGLASLLYVLWLLRRGAVPRWLGTLKYVGTAAAALTFLVVLAILGPFFGWRSMYRNANLWFHLLLPLVSMLSFCLFDELPPLPKRAALWAVAPALVYGLAYLGNILLNGVGQWPHSNDWYGFAHWGIPAGVGIFALILLLNWVLALGLRAGNRRFAQRVRQ